VVFDFLGAGERMGLHYRRGKHAHTEEDWTVLLDFADVQLMGKTNDVKLDVMGFADQAKAFSWRRRRSRIEVEIRMTKLESSNQARM